MDYVYFTDEDEYSDGELVIIGHSDNAETHINVPFYHLFDTHDPSIPPDYRYLNFCQYFGSWRMVGPFIIRHIINEHVLVIQCPNSDCRSCYYVYMPTIIQHRPFGRTVRVGCNRCNVQSFVSMENLMQASNFEKYLPYERVKHKTRPKKRRRLVNNMIFAKYVGVTLAKIDRMLCICVLRKSNILRKQIFYLTFLGSEYADVVFGIGKSSIVTFLILLYCKEDLEENNLYGSKKPHHGEYPLLCKLMSNRIVDFMLVIQKYSDSEDPWGSFYKYEELEF